MKSFREWLREGELYKVVFTDPMGNKSILSSLCRITNDSGVSVSINELDYIVNKSDVTAETGNSGDKHYSEYLTKRIKIAASKSKNNDSFAKELNKIFKVNIFHAV